MKKEYKNIFFHGYACPPSPQARRFGATIVSSPCAPGGNEGPIKNIFLYSFLFMVIFLFSTRAFASLAGEVNKANALYKQGKFDDALDLYQDALDHDEKSPVVKYDLGTALYKKGDYTKALGYLEQAVQDKNVKIKPKAEYNLGNALYKSGMQKANTNVDEAIKTLQEALGNYGESLEINPKDQDALFNQDFVKKEIERLKQKKQQQRQQNQQNRSGRQNQKKNQQSSSGSQAQKQQNSQARAEKNQKELDRKQAEDLLREYQENEEPRKLLNYMPRKIDERPVLKDW